MIIFLLLLQINCDSLLLSLPPIHTVQSLIFFEHWSTKQVSKQYYSLFVVYHLLFVLLVYKHRLVKFAVVVKKKPRIWCLLLYRCHFHFSRRMMTGMTDFYVKPWLDLDTLFQCFFISKQQYTNTKKKYLVKTLKVTINASHRNAQSMFRRVFFKSFIQAIIHEMNKIFFIVL